jgi:hypothetical protein
MPVTVAANLYLLFIYLFFFWGGGKWVKTVFAERPKPKLTLPQHPPSSCKEFIFERIWRKLPIVCSAAPGSSMLSSRPASSAACKQDYSSSVCLALAPWQRRWRTGFS